jgi:hypothetical protein
MDQTQNLGKIWLAENLACRSGPPYTGNGKTGMFLRDQAAGIQKISFCEDGFSCEKFQD